MNNAADWKDAARTALYWARWSREKRTDSWFGAPSVQMMLRVSVHTYLAAAGDHRRHAMEG